MTWRLYLAAAALLLVVGLNLSRDFSHPGRHLSPVRPSLLLLPLRRSTPAERIFSEESVAPTLRSCRPSFWRDPCPRTHFRLR
jgi:hypothetical protein